MSPPRAAFARGYPGEASLGDTGPHVRAWQGLLIAGGVISDNAANHDGYYGRGMRRAVSDLQRSWGWTPDGVAGPRTYERLMAELGRRQGSVDPRFATCPDARAAGYGPYVVNVDPEYAWYVDVDGDGMVCEG